MPCEFVCEFIGRSHVGLLRHNNEDAFAFDPSGCMVLADGLGGHQAGEVASRMTVEYLANALPSAFAEISPTDLRRGLSTLRDEIKNANLAVIDAAQSFEFHRGMGTTVVAGVFHHRHLLFGHAGDSRAYLWRDHALTRLTRDHTRAQSLLDAGLIPPDDTRVRREQNILTKSLGARIDLEPDIQVCDLQQGDVYLLCSDGLTDMLPDPAIAQLLVEYDWHKSAFHLIRCACERGGLDNITVLLAKVGPARSI